MNIYAISGFLLSAFSAGYWGPWSPTTADARGHESCQGAETSVTLTITPANVAQGQVVKDGSQRQVDTELDVELDLSWPHAEGVDTVLEWYVADDRGNVYSRVEPAPHSLRAAEKKAVVSHTVDIASLEDGYYHLTAAIAAAGASSASVETHEQTLYFSKKEGRVDFLTYAEWDRESSASLGVDEPSVDTKEANGRTNVEVQP